MCTEVQVQRWGTHHPVGHRDEVGDAKGLTTNPPTQTDASTDCMWGDVGETDFFPQSRGQQWDSALNHRRDGTIPLPPHPPVWSHCHLISTETSWLLCSGWRVGGWLRKQQLLSGPRLARPLGGWTGPDHPQHPLSPSHATTTKGLEGGEKELALPGPCLLPL